MWGFLGLHFLSFWFFGPSFPFILAFWAFISFHFGLLGRQFLSFCAFGHSFPFNFLRFLGFSAFISFHFGLLGLISFHFGLLGLNFFSLCFQKAPGPDLPLSLGGILLVLGGILTHLGGVLHILGGILLHFGGFLFAFCGPQTCLTPALLKNAYLRRLRKPKFALSKLQG